MTYLKYLMLKNNFSDYRKGTTMEEVKEKEMEESKSEQLGMPLGY